GSTQHHQRRWVGRASSTHQENPGRRDQQRHHGGACPQRKRFRPVPHQRTHPHRTTQREQRARQQHGRHLFSTEEHGLRKNAGATHHHSHQEPDNEQRNDRRTLPRGPLLSLPLRQADHSHHRREQHHAS